VISTPPRRSGAAIGDVMNGDAGLSVITGATDHVVIDAAAHVRLLLSDT